MGLDFKTLKEQISLRDLFIRDGHILKREGSRTKCLSPFKEEKTPSCLVEENHFHCFSSGEHGDHFDYLQKTRGINLKEATELLAQIVGAVPFADKWQKTKPVSKPIKRELMPISSEAFDKWQEGMKWLASNEKVQCQIAAWRSYSPSTIHQLLSLGKIGCPLYGGERLVAFSVEAPQTNGELFQIAYHLRLKPESKSKKASWRFFPSGVPSLPFVLGNPIAAKVLVIVEGQWDAIAFADAAGWFCLECWPIEIAVVGIRGGHNWKLFIERFKWPKDTVALVICDRDETGETWCDDLSFIAVLRELCKAVHVFEPKVGKDFNDVLKYGLHRAKEVRDEQV